MGISNLESRIVKLENTAKTEFGTPVSAIFFPVRKLMLTEEVSHDEGGVAFPVLVATWDKPAGVLLPDSIRLIHNDTTVSLPGTATSYRMTGYAVDATISVKVTAIYAQGNSSTIIAEKTISGDIEPPSVPTYLTVTGGVRTLTLRWENPTAEDFSHVEIWESVTDNNIATSERIAQAYGTEFVRSNCGVLEIRWYWIRALDANGNFSDFTSVASGTTTAIAMEDIPENTISESMLVDALAQKIDDTDAAIQIVEDVRMGEVNVFRQASAPTTGMITGDLWIDNTEVVHRYEGGEWVSKEGTPVYDLLKTAIAQYVVKTQTVTGDGQLKVAGFGLYNDSTTGSEFAILADKFYVYAQKEDGSSYSNMQVFTVDATTTPPTVGINGNLIVDGSIVGEKIYAGAKIQLGAGGQFIAGDGAIFQLGGDGEFIKIDSEQGVIKIMNTNTGDYLLMDKGDITTYHKFTGQSYFTPLKSLRQLETGEAQNGVRTTLAKRFPSQPEITLSMKDVAIYAPEYQASKQSVKCYLNKNEISYNASTGVCSFIPYIKLTTVGGTTGISLSSTMAGAVIPLTQKWVVSDTTYTIMNYSVSLGIDTLYLSINVYAQVGSGSHNGDASWHRTYTIYAYLTVNGVDYLVGSVSYSKAADTYDQELSAATSVEKYGTFNIAGNINIARTTSAVTGTLKLRVYGHGDTYGNALNGKTSLPNSSHVWGHVLALRQTGVSTTIDANGYVTYMAISE